MTTLQVTQSKMPNPVTVGTPVPIEVKRRILSNCHPEIRKISFSFRFGELTLNGEVRSYYLKQIAQAIVRDIGGIKKITNNVNVVYQKDMKDRAS